MQYSRVDRVADLIRQEVATIILRGELKDPRIGLVTITGVKLSKDLKNAKVFFSMLAEKDEIEKSLQGLNSACGFIRRELAKKLTLKNIPTVSFMYDDSLEYSSHIEEVLKDIDTDENEGLE